LILYNVEELSKWAKEKGATTSSNIV